MTIQVCNACRAPRPDGDEPDPCLGWLPGVAFACCGHGHGRMAYVLEQADVPRMNEPGWDCPRGDAARERLRELGGDPAPGDGARVVVAYERLWPRTEA